jgi:ABC-2 type transport system ATP-binding protein
VGVSRQWAPPVQRYAEIGQLAAEDILHDCGSDRNRAEDLGRAGNVIARFGQGGPQFDEDLKRVSIPTRDGPSGLITAGRLLEEQGIGLADLGIRRPSLDDVFLTLTGHGAGQRPAPQAGGHRTYAADGNRS